jgi:hypothetical protein
VDERSRFLDLVRRNPVNVAILERAPALAVPDWWLAAGALCQTVWNVQAGRNPTAGMGDYDLVYFDDTDLSYEAEDAVIRRARRLFADLAGVVEVRNQARVHLWYEEHFGEPGARFRSSADAIDHFPTTATSVGVARSGRGELVVYAPFGLDDVLAGRVRPNPRSAPRSVYEAKTQRWRTEWPTLAVEPWPDLP